MNYFVYDGAVSLDYGVAVADGNKFDAPKRSVEELVIPGRNGTLTIDNGRFENFIMSYHVYARGDILKKLAEFKSRLMCTRGYRRLEDTFYPEMYRLAKFIDVFEVVKSDRFGAAFDIRFDCMPQRFFKHGEIPLPIINGGVLHNETLFAALPLIRVYGTSGTLYIGSTVCQLISINEYVDLDSETQNAYKGTANCNMNVYIPEFPVLDPGMTSIHWEGEIKQVRITPRWWTI